MAIVSPGFRALLESEYEWPAEYTFKFVVPVDQLEQAEALVDSTDITRRPSRNGRYVGLTIRAVMESADAVIETYERASRIGGMLAL